MLVSILARMSRQALSTATEGFCEFVAPATLSRRVIALNRFMLEHFCNRNVINMA